MSLSGALRMGLRAAGSSQVLRRAASKSWGGPSMATRAAAFSTRTMATSASSKKTGDKDNMYGRTGGTVQDVLEIKGKSFYKCRADDTVYHAIEEMVRHNIGSLVVVEPHKNIGSWKPVGIITERDYMEKGIVLGRSSKETYVHDIMSSKGLISVKPSANLHQIMELMTENHIRHVPVVDEGDSLIGMISIGDVVKELVNSHKKEMAEMASFVSGAIY